MHQDAAHNAERLEHETQDDRDTLRLTRRAQARRTEFGTPAVASGVHVAPIIAGPALPDVGPKTLGQTDKGSWLWWQSLSVRLGIDAALTLSALLCAELSAPGRIGPSSPVWVLIFTGLVLAFLSVRGAYRPRLRIQLLDNVRLVVSTTALAAMAVLAARVLLADDPEAAGQTVRQWGFAVLFLASGRAVLDLAEIRARERGRAGRRTLIVGAGNVGRLVARRLAQYPELGLMPIGFLDDAPLENGEPAIVPVLGGSGDLGEIIDHNRIEHVIVTFSTASHLVLLRIVDQCGQLGVAVSFVPRLFEKMKEKMSIESVGSIPLILVEPTDPKSWQFTVKYILDRIVSAGLLVLLSPIFLATAVAVWVSSGRPIFYGQERVGRDGRQFRMLKFRSMAEPSRDALDPVNLPPDTAPGGVEGAERRTRLGTILRRTALDELPQLVNVLKGEMSLVGPRPERPEFVEVFENSIHRYAERHRVKAGITGWAQVNGLRGNTSLSDRAEWDNYYIDNWSLWLDLKILLSTAAALVRSPSE